MSASMMKMIAMSSVNSVWSEGTLPSHMNSDMGHSVPVREREAFMQVWNMPELKEYIYAYDPTYKNMFKPCLEECMVEVSRRRFKQCVQELPMVAERYSIFTIIRSLVGKTFLHTTGHPSCEVVNWNGQGVVGREDEWVLGNFTAQTIMVRCFIHDIHDDPDEPFLYEAVYHGIRYDQETQSWQYDDVRQYLEPEDEF